MEALKEEKLKSIREREITVKNGEKWEVSHEKL